MDDHQDPANTEAGQEVPHEEEAPATSTEPNQEEEAQRLHRLVIPMILDILRSRGERIRGSSPSTRARNHQDTLSSIWDGLGGAPQEENDEPPPLISDPTTPQDSDNMDIDGVSETPDVSNARDTATPLDSQDDSVSTDQQGQLIPSPVSPSTTNSTSSPSANRRSRYRLVVYFEERDILPSASGEGTTHDGSSDNDETSPLLPRSDDASSERPTSRASNRRRHNPSRYVAVFSIDSDAQNMPIIHSAGLLHQQSPQNFDDILNQLFASYMPKGTPPAKKEIIDTLPTTTHTQQTCGSQGKCAVCLEEFCEGAEVVVLPCTHRFHGEECVKPWLRMHSSCPICRYEMPVDDAEYEEKRKERMAKRTPTPPVGAEDLSRSQEGIVVDGPPL